MDLRVKAYNGGGRYVFVCYAHANAAVVYPLLELLTDREVNVWYDEGIEAGTVWTDTLAHAIQGCARVIYFVSPQSVVSEHCRREINFAQEEGLEVVAVHLEPTEMPSGLRLILNNRQAVLRSELLPDDFDAKLVALAGASTLADAEMAPTDVQTRVSGAAPVRGSVEHAKRRTLGWLGWAVGAMSIAVLLAYLSIGEPEEPIPSQTPDAAIESDVIPNSIAVLPLRNLSTDPENAYVAAGIHGTILHELSRVGGLQVIGRNTIQKYAETEADLKTLARELRVSSVLEGSVQFSGDQIQIQVALIDPASGTTLWSSSYQHSIGDLFATQREIAEHIADALSVEVRGVSGNGLGGDQTTSAEAILFFLKARAITSNVGPFMPPEFYVFLNAALEEDPGFGLAHGLKSMGLVLSLGLVGVDGMDTRTQEEAVLHHADLALESPESAGYGYAAHAMVAEQHRQWNEADRFWRRAVASNPNDFDILDDYARYMAFRGDMEVANVILARTQDLNPVDWQLEIGLAVLKGDYETVLRLVPPQQLRQQVLALTILGRGDEAVDLLRTVASGLPNPSPASAFLCYLFGRNELPQEAERFCGQADEFAEGELPVASALNAKWITALGRRDPSSVLKALEAIEQSSEAQGPFYFQYINNTFLDPLLDQPDVLEVRRRLGYHG